MATYRISTMLAWGSLMLTLWLLYRIHAELPERLATHWGTDGRPNGWMSNAGFIWAIIGLSSVSNLLLRGMMRLTPGSRLVNLPYKDYWMASPDRRRIVASKMRGTFLRTIAYMNCLWLFCCYAVYRANGLPTPPPSSAIPAVVAILAVTGGFIFLIVWDFRPPNTTE